MSLKDFNDLVKQVRARNPEITFKEAQAMAKKLRSIQYQPTAPPILADPPVKSPTYQVPPVIHIGAVKEKEQPDPVAETVLNKFNPPANFVASKPEQPEQHDFNIDEIIKELRSGSGIMHFRSVMFAHLQGRGTIVEDGMDGRNHVCHIEVEGFRIPPEPDDYFKY